MRRTGLKPRTSSLVGSRKRIKPISDRRLAQAPARRVAVAEAIKRDGECRFLAAYANALHRPDWTDKELDRLRRAERCIGTLVGHEPAHSRNVDRTDSANVIALCVFHNNWVEDHPEISRKLGLIVRGNGFPLRHVGDAEAAP